MNKELKRVSVVVLALFIALMVSTTTIQFAQKSNLAADPRNSRVLLDSYDTERGAILAGDEVIAQSVPTDDTFKYQRVYAQGPLYAPITGYFNPMQGSSGLERSMNDVLSGRDNTQFFDSLNRILTGQAPKGGTVQTTIDPEIQRVAADALGGRQGAIVAMEPATGRILAMTTSPDYDPNQLASHDADAVKGRYAELLADPTEPLINRATGGGLNPPGSAFKIVVVAAAFASGQYTAASTLPNPASMTLPGTSTKVYNWTRAACGPGDEVTIAEAIRQSCNIPLAELAIRLGYPAIKEQAEKFGFNQELGIPTSTTPSVYPPTANDAELGLSGFGQMNVRSSPLQMAMMSAAIGNDGVLMKPTLVDHVIGSSLDVLAPFSAEKLRETVSPEVAAELTKVMVAGVANGQASNARIGGVDVAGKTGTAQNGDNEPYTLWFTGFAPAENPDVAVAVVLENDAGLGHHSSGNLSAAPIARKVIEAVLNK